MISSLKNMEISLFVKVVRSPQKIFLLLILFEYTSTTEDRIVQTYDRTAREDGVCVFFVCFCFLNFAQTPFTYKLLNKVVNIYWRSWMLKWFNF